MLHRTLTLLSATLLPVALTACGGSKASDAPAPLVAEAPTGKEVEIKLNLAKGDKKALVAKINVDMDIKAGRDKNKVGMVMGMDMGFEVLDVDADGNHEMSFTFDRMKMAMSGMPQEVDYDSSRPGSEDTPVGMEISPMLGFPITMTMTPTGEIKDIGDMSDAPQILRTQFDQGQNNMEMVATYPKVPVDNGDTWTLERTQNDSGIEMTMKATYTLLEHNDKKVRVGVSGKLSGGMAGWLHGEMDIDPATGWVRSATMKMQAAGEQDGQEMEMVTDMSFSDS